MRFSTCSAARREHQQRLGDRRDRLALPVQHELAHALGERRAARLARETHT